jgi:hypothetical protein
MATIQDLLRQYKPELDLEEAVPADETLDYLEENSELDRQTIEAVLGQLPDLLYWFLMRGRPVTLPGVGQIRPIIHLDGSITAGIEADEQLVARMSEPDAYRAGIDRRENIGADIQRLAQMWNSSHPNDTITDL